MCPFAQELSAIPSRRLYSNMKQKQNYRKRLYKSYITSLRGETACTAGTNLCISS